ncbi:hypothetical protein SAPIO_CDS6218 [Scedosporium apiospermum]|uniref:Uncharacterized protein n=1 Tax=Pseudallescheria apiosperma TaxID=563466 RepID=A0A084G4A0_PSEDA|nr:uncharacterized protein SAPIO_CDS6218 [Scedosporium apiospermum]KEZ42162.1 hypothetical protein SAPIO_CDS6218 [Scedosporium apiospermum]
MTRGILTSLLDTIKADPWAMWLISSQYDGFHHMRANKTYNDTFYFGCWHSAIAWTFCRQSASTRAIWITRQGISEHRDWDMDDKRNPIPEFLTSLDSYAPLTHVPYVLAIALALATMLDYDARILRQLQQIEEVEEGTGFTRKHMVSGNLDHAYDVDKLTQWSRLCSGLRINTTNLLRHHDNCMRLFEYIADSEKEGPNLAAGTTYSGEYDRSMADILEMTRVLKMRADSFSTYASYIRDRAEAQVNVIFALLTHEDSVANLKSAEASKGIAAAAKRDSSAMKTVAVMTMAFLPATFLAALFALPALEWAKPVVVKMDGFVLYWITTIILTVTVFVPY